MTTTALPAPGLGSAVLGHLGRQIASARRLLELILRQGAAIRERRVEDVVGALLEIQREMAARGELETEREGVLRRAAGALGTSPLDVTLGRLRNVLDDDDARRADEDSAQLRGLLGEIAREHAINRALMRQELAFLDHLTRLAGGEPGPGYGRDAAPQSATATHVAAGLHTLDARA